MKRLIFESEHEQLRASAKAFVEREIAPYAEQWERDGIIDREAFKKAGEAGLVGFYMPEEFGGSDIDDFRFNAVVIEEMAKFGSRAPAFTLQNDVIGPYLKKLCSDEQKERWLPGFASGEIIGAIAMTEPGAGSDLAGIKTSAALDGDHWVLNGAKTFISCGINADLVIVVTRTDPEAGHKGFTLLGVERGMEGFERGRNLDKLGQHAQDTAELSFTNVRVPAANVIGEVNKGFYHLMHNLPSERLAIGVGAVAGARKAFEDTLVYVSERKAFGQSVGSFQANRHKIAEIATELDIAQAFVDRCIQGAVDGELTAVDASKAKWWCTELAKRIVDTCLQLHGGYGYMAEYPISRIYADVRIETIYGGTTEIMKDIIGRDLGF
ncbi:acyl-CoA dehydrogenase family protein [Williamsia sp.]|uniref:acyl-CoA dehydrogenase family protein n=1 Tax=Williamsia sp. TaxID=1872085 RepID=UPI001A18CFE0|nr:acyl-CoA dehydrogenase family protein [Williamsia sp.]MBJ7290699.1 acyl-CoA dehydrogenase family protein [Williamsia sp.]